MESNRSKAGDPYAYKAKLVRCIVGLIRQRNNGKETMACNRIAVKEIHSSDLANHHFQMTTTIQDIGKCS